MGRSLQKVWSLFLVKVVCDVQVAEFGRVIKGCHVRRQRTVNRVRDEAKNGNERS